MLEYLINGNFKGFLQALTIDGAVVFACWLMITGACLVDFWSGCSTAKSMGQKLNSHGFRKTVDKLCDYMKLALMSLFFDLIGSLFSWYAMPYASMLIAVCAILIEGKSVVENSQRKKANAGKIPHILKEIVKATTTEEGKRIFKEIGELVDSVNKSSKWADTDEQKD